MSMLLLQRLGHFVARHAQADPVAFDALATDIASGVSRREALLRLAGAVLGSAAAAIPLPILAVSAATPCHDPSCVQKVMDVYNKAYPACSALVGKLRLSCQNQVQHDRDAGLERCKTV